MYEGELISALGEMFDRIPMMNTDTESQMKFLFAAEENYKYLKNIYSNINQVEYYFISALSSKIPTSMNLYDIVTSPDVTTYAEFKYKIIRSSNLKAYCIMLEHELFTFLPFYDEHPHETALRLERILAKFRKVLIILESDETVIKSRIDFHEGRLLEKVPRALDEEYALIASLKKFETFEDFKNFLFEIEYYAGSLRKVYLKHKKENEELNLKNGNRTSEKWTKIDKSMNHTRVTRKNSEKFNIFQHFKFMPTELHNEYESSKNTSDKMKQIIGANEEINYARQQNEMLQNKKVGEHNYDSAYSGIDSIYDVIDITWIKNVNKKKINKKKKQSKNKIEHVDINDTDDDDDFKKTLLEIISKSNKLRADKNRIKNGIYLEIINDSFNKINSHLQNDEEFYLKSEKLGENTQMYVCMFIIAILAVH